ncbi:MAG: cupin-like domain-containing protein, partial [Pseudomonadota bacterium]|nr:cupin-like domain-containing protein [Pseudomonadota bacterium]
VTPITQVTEWHAVDRRRFEQEIVLRHLPGVLRGVVAHWPAVQLATTGEPAAADATLARWLSAMDNGHPVDALLLHPRYRGRIHYGDGFAQGQPGFNFLRNQVPISQVIEQLLRYAQFTDPPAVAVQSALAADCLPGFSAGHPMPLLDESVAPRVWLGNAIVTPTHFDESANIACVVAGERRFTLFPPEQVGNLYVGPLHHAPTGTPVSLPDPDAPDLDRFPRYARALQAAQQAVLGPGDALYIPPLWWHHVASRKPLNLLVNYWWRGRPGASGIEALMLARQTFGPMPSAERRAWQALLAHWVFDADEQTQAHLPPALRDEGFG